MGTSITPISAGGTTHQRFLHCTNDFLMQVIVESKRRGDLLDVILTNKEERDGDVKVKGRLGCNDHEMVGFRGPFHPQPFCDSVRSEDTGSIYKV